MLKATQWADSSRTTSCFAEPAFCYPVLAYLMLRADLMLSGSSACRFLTHYKRLIIDPAWREHFVCFWGRARLRGQHLGPCLLQFPPTLKASSPLKAKVCSLLAFTLLAVAQSSLSGQHFESCLLRFPVGQGQAQVNDSCQAVQQRWRHQLGRERPAAEARQQDIQPLGAQRLHSVAGSQGVTGSLAVLQVYDGLTKVDGLQDLCSALKSLAPAGHFVLEFRCAAALPTCTCVSSGSYRQQAGCKSVCGSLQPLYCTQLLHIEGTSLTAALTLSFGDVLS